MRRRHGATKDEKQRGREERQGDRIGSDARSPRLVLTIPVNVNERRAYKSTLRRQLSGQAL